MGPYGAERQTAAVELALRDVQHWTQRRRSVELNWRFSQAAASPSMPQPSLVTAQRKSEIGPLQGSRTPLVRSDDLFSTTNWIGLGTGRGPAG